MVGKESKKGHSFYVAAGMKQVTAYIPLPLYRKLKFLARREERSVQKTLVRIIDRGLRRIQPGREGKSDKNR